MFSRFLKGYGTSPAEAPTPPKPAVVHIDTPEEHLAKAIKCASESNFTQCLTHISPFATSWTSEDPNHDRLSPQEKMKMGGKIEELNQIIRRRLEELLRGDDHVTVCSACRILFCLQSLQSNSSSDNEAQEIYLDFLEKIVHKDATELMKVLVEESDTTTSASVMADLFSLVGEIIQDAIPLVQHFSSEGPNQLVARVHKQCSSHIITIFELFSEELNLIDTVQQLQTQKQSPTSDIANSLISNPLQLDETLQTISLMCAYSARYMTFVQSKSTLADYGQLQTFTQVMLGHYLALESFYLENAIAEAIKSNQEGLIQELNAAAAVPTTSPKPPQKHPHSTYENPSSTNLPPNPTSNPSSSSSFSSSPPSTPSPHKNTLVDDGFFVLKKSLRRGLSTMSHNVACAIINSASMALESPYFSFFENVIDRFYVLASDTYLELLNDLELSSEYIAKLNRDMAGDIVRLYPAIPEKTKLIHCLDDLVKSSTQYCTKLRNKNIALYTSKLNVKIESAFLSMFIPISYELDENTYEQAELNDPFMSRFLEFLGELLTPVQQKFRDANRVEVAANLAKFISGKFESAVLTKRFSSLGAVQLSKEVRQLGDYFASVGGQPLRYQFTRLAQISQLLNLDRVIDCMEYWIEGKAVFKLDANEVRLVLTRRIDFTPESINALKL